MAKHSDVSEWRRIYDDMAFSGQERQKGRCYCEAIFQMNNEVPVCIFSHRGDRRADRICERSCRMDTRHAER